MMRNISRQTTSTRGGAFGAPGAYGALADSSAPHSTNSAIANCCAMSYGSAPRSCSLNLEHGTGDRALCAAEAAGGLLGWKRRESAESFTLAWTARKRKARSKRKGVQEELFLLPSLFSSYFIVILSLFLIIFFIFVILLFT